MKRLPEEAATSSRYFSAANRTRGGTIAYKGGAEAQAKNPAAYRWRTDKASPLRMRTESAWHHPGPHIRRAGGIFLISVRYSAIQYENQGFVN
jgi:hypothetical protein